jgi:hypothetical protein
MVMPLVDEAPALDEGGGVDVVVVWANVGRLNARPARAAAAMHWFFFMVRLLMLMILRPAWTATSVPRHPDGRVALTRQLRSTELHSEHRPHSRFWKSAKQESFTVQLQLLHRRVDEYAGQHG